MRTNLTRVVRWAKLGLLGSPDLTVQGRRLRLLALSEALGLSDHDMLKLKDHPSWGDDGPVDLSSAREVLREAKRSLLKPHG